MARAAARPAAILGLEPGDELEIRLSKTQIRLVPIGGSEAADDEE